MVVRLSSTNENEQLPSTLLQALMMGNFPLTKVRFSYQVGCAAYCHQEKKDKDINYLGVHLYETVALIGGLLG